MRKIDPSKLSPRTRQQLVDMLDLESASVQAQDAKLATLTWTDAFDLWCNYEGLINYGPRLRALALELAEAANG